MDQTESLEIMEWFVECFDLYAEGDLSPSACEELLLTFKQSEKDLGKIYED